MQRRSIIRLAGALALFSPMAAIAQDASKMRRIGLLTPGLPLPDASPLVKTLVAVLGEHGYQSGKNLQIERRAAEGHVDRLPQLIAELAASKPDVIVTTGYPSAAAAKQGTTLPIVALNAGDPVGTGLVASLAHPGG